MRQEFGEFCDLETVEPRRLSQVWPGGGMFESATWGEADLAAVLRHQLGAPLEFAAPLEFGAASESGEPPAPGAPRTFGELLRHPAPPADALRRVKDFAKPAMSPAAGDEALLPREVAAVLYFASIVAARARGGGPISSLDDKGLRDGAAWALRQPWLDPALADLFREGLAAVGGRLGVSRGRESSEGMTWRP